MSAAYPQTLVLQPGQSMPNNRLPVLVYRGVLPPNAASKAADFARMFEANGWAGIWRNGVFDYDHFHSNAHEVLGVGEGRATLQLGGDTGEPIDVEPGDVVLLPAGTGHRCLHKSENFRVVGAYPPGQQDYDICRHRTNATDARIAALPLPETDPVGGAAGPATRLWRNS